MKVIEEEAENRKKTFKKFFDICLHLGKGSKPFNQWMHDRKGQDRRT